MNVRMAGVQTANGGIEEEVADDDNDVEDQLEEGVDVEPEEGNCDEEDDVDEEDDDGDDDTDDDDVDDSLEVDVGR